MIKLLSLCLFKGKMAYKLVASFIYQNLKYIALCVLILAYVFHTICKYLIHIPNYSCSFTCHNTLQTHYRMGTYVALFSCINIVHTVAKIKGANSKTAANIKVFDMHLLQIPQSATGRSFL